MTFHAHEPVSVDLPIPPSTNALYRNVRGRGRVKTERYCEWIRAASWDFKDQKPRPVHGPIKIEIAFGRYRDKRRRDIDNRVKGALDGLKDFGVIEDDHLVQELRIYWADDVLPGRCTVSIRRAA